MSIERDPGHRCSVLVVDADAEVAELLRVALGGDGYAVSTAANGREALDHLRSHAETCVIVLELQLPVMDGALFRTAQLRDRSLAWIPVVAMSAAFDGARRARAIGAHDFVAKPLDLDQLRATLGRIECRQARPSLR